MVIEIWYIIMVEIFEVKLYYFEIFYIESYLVIIYKVNYKVLGIF